jgi:hypothetical protein
MKSVQVTRLHRDFSGTLAGLCARVEP